MQKLSYKSLSFNEGTIFLYHKGFVVILLLLVTAFSYGQVWTTKLIDKTLEDVIPNHSDKPVSEANLMPPVDIEAVLRQDSIEGRIMYRYGVRIPTFLRKSDGEMEDEGRIVIWKTSVLSSEATSLSLHLSNVFLPSGAKMYIYNKAGTMYSGPVTSQHIFNGIYTTDAIYGEEVVLEVTMPAESYEAFDLQIDAVIHGFRKFFKNDGLTLRGYDDSGTCNVDVNCPTGQGWEDERDAVALILTSEGRLCTGALVNNECQDLTPYFLTARHCIIGENVGNWTFRFHYDSPDPTSPSCRGSEPTSWLTYSGATLRADDGTSNFALLELNQSVIGQSTLALAGWDRTSTTPASGTGIHHPMGDVKKISTTTGAPTLTSQTGGTGTDYIQVVWGLGTTEKGSSGSPLFNANQRVIGQLWGGNASCTNPTGHDRYGRFFISWTGGGTDATRLSNWLGVGSATTTNTIRPPYITGPSEICTANATFTLNNPIPGLSVSWAVSPSNLFAGSTSGTGASATVQGRSGVSGQATISFTIDTGTGCTDVVLYKNFWVGTVSNAYTSISGDTPVCPYELAGYTANVSNYLAEATVTAYNWFEPSGWTVYYENDNELVLQPPYGFVSDHVEVSITNSCGTSSPKENFQVDENYNCSYPLSAYPNPAEESLTVEFENYAPAVPVELVLRDLIGRPVIYRKSQKSKEVLNVANLQQGIYFLEIKKDDNLQVRKIFINR